MKYIILSILLTFCIPSSSTAQLTCEDILEAVQTHGTLTTSYCCFNSSFLTGVKFYTYTENYKTLYFAAVQFNLGKWYIYQVANNVQSDFGIYAFSDNAGDAFHQYIHSYRDVLGCAPRIRR